MSWISYPKVLCKISKGIESFFDIEYPSTKCPNFNSPSLTIFDFFGGWGSKCSRSAGIALITQKKEKDLFKKYKILFWYKFQPLRFIFENFKQPKFLNVKQNVDNKIE